MQVLYSLENNIPDEILRLENLNKYKILDSHAEPEFDVISAGLAMMFEAPLAFVIFVDKDRVWFKSSHYGQAGDSYARDTSFCDKTIQKDSVTIIEDTLLHPHFRTNPYVLNEPRLRFYAAMPVKTKEGFNIGTVCIADTLPRKFSEREYQRLEKMAIKVSLLLEKRLRKIEEED